MWPHGGPLASGVAIIEVADVLAKFAFHNLLVK
jgi:hypothetical protein